MNITMLTESLGSGGAERQLCTLAVEMKRRGHFVQVVTYAPGDFYRPMLEEAGIKNIFLGGTGRWDWLSRVRRFLRHDQQDVVLAFLQSCAVYAELSALPCRRWGLVVSERLALPDQFGGQSRFGKYFHLVADAVTVNSHANRLMLEAAVPWLKNRMVTIYNAVDLNRFKPATGLRSSNDFRLVVAARINRQKNLSGAIDAIDLLRRRHGIRVSVDWFGNTADDQRLWHTCQKQIKQLRLSESFHIYPPPPTLFQNTSKQTPSFSPRSTRAFPIRYARVWRAVSRSS
jgi:glycosyltransferase involved in cell wall biosynthesis